MIFFCAHQRKVFLTKYPYTAPTEMPGKILEPPQPKKIKIIYALCCLHWQRGAELLWMRYSDRSPS